MDKQSGNKASLLWFGMLKGVSPSIDFMHLASRKSLIGLYLMLDERSVAGIIPVFSVPHMMRVLIVILMLILMLN
jgi:hypothetical protein